MQLSFLKNNIIDQVVWLGAGDCAKADLPFSSKTKLHLVDADETITQSLHKRFKQQKNVIIHALLIAQNNQNADFKHYSLSEFNGIAEPAALKQYYPGLKQLKVENKPTKSITAFIAEIGLSTQQNNTIIFDLPGLSATLIQTLLKENALHQFNTLIISISKQPLFKDEPQATDLIQQLEKNGFLCQMHQSNAQDYAIIQAQLNPLYNAITATKQQLASTEAELKNKQTLLSNTQKELEQLTQENKTTNKQLAETIAQLTKLQTQNKQEQAEANKKKEAQQNQITILTQQNIELEKQLEQKQTEHQKQLAQSQKQHEQSLQAESDLKLQLEQNQQEIGQLKTELHQMNEKNTQQQEQLKLEAEQKTELAKQLEQKQTEHQNQLAQLGKDNAGLKELLAQSQKQHEQSQQTQSELKLQQDNMQIELYSEQIKKKFETLEGNFRDYLNKGLANTVLQIESFVSLSNFLNDGTLPLSYHGWPISPDIALYLTQLIEYNEYDLIIEFGSGTSTILFSRMAQKLLNESRKTPQLITFEHNKTYFEETQKNLKSQSLDASVRLVYAPLKDYLYEGVEYLYYDCESTLQDLVTNKAQQKILVLVDGPPGATCQHARFPAVPHLLKFFSQSALFLVLDDHARQEEKDISKKWEEILNNRSIVYESGVERGEKGIYFLKIN